MTVKFADLLRFLLHAPDDFFKLPLGSLRILEGVWNEKYRVPLLTAQVLGKGGVSGAARQAGSSNLPLPGLGDPLRWRGIREARCPPYCRGLQWPSRGYLSTGVHTKREA